MLVIGRESAPAFQGEYQTQGEDEQIHGAAIVDEAELGHLASLIARLTPAQQRLVVALADGFRGGWLEPFQWERAWQGCDLDDDGVLGDARTWLARRPRHSLDRLDHVG